MRPLLPIAFLLTFYPLVSSLDVDKLPYKEEEKVCACPLTGDTYTVTTLADSGDGSLREAITCCNADPSLTNITFSVAGTIFLNSGLPNITATGLNVTGTAFDIEINGSNLSGGGKWIDISRCW